MYTLNPGSVHSAVLCLPALHPPGAGPGFFLSRLILFSAAAFLVLLPFPERSHLFRINLRAVILFLLLGDQIVIQIPVKTLIDQMLTWLSCPLIRHLSSRN